MAGCGPTLLSAVHGARAADEVAVVQVVDVHALATDVLVAGAPHNPATASMFR